MTQSRILAPLEGYPPEIGAALWALEDARVRTKRAISEVDHAALDYLPNGADNTIGTLLYHISAIEVDYLYADILQTSFPPEIEILFPYDVRDENGWLTRVAGLSLDDHLSRMDKVRAALLSKLKGMDVAEFRRPRQVGDYTITPQYALHHLAQHEAEHRGELMLVSTLIRKGR